MLQAKLFFTLKSKDLATCGFQKNSRHAHQNPLKLSPVSERSAYPLQNYTCFSPLTSGLESFGHKLLPLTGPGLRPNVQNSRKSAGPRMLEGQLSRVPWPGNSWMPFTFQPALRALQHHYIQQALSIVFFCIFLKSNRISSKYRTVTSKH